MTPPDPEDPRRDTADWDDDETIDTSGLEELDTSSLSMDFSGETAPVDISRIDAQLTAGDPSLPEFLGPYRVLKVIGQGGMGMVCLGEQEHPVHRKVALKVIKTGVASKEMVARFQAEQQALALMNHPNIAGEYEANTSEEGWPYIVMEYVPGLPITDYCDQNRLGTEERLQLFIQVCDAIQHAHHKGIIHRDIKPGNVLVTELDENRPLPKVIDFGIAKALEGNLTDRTMLTEQGMIVGTPAYMSPEQADPNQDVDTRTDIYSLGILLYEMLIGALPFDFDSLGGSGGFMSIQRMILEKEPVRPSTRLRELAKDTTRKVAENRQTDPAALIRRLRGDLDWISLKCMEKDRVRRYPSASELIADLERYLTHEPVLAGPPSLLYRARKYARKHRAPLVVASLFVLLLTGLGGFGIYMSGANFREGIGKLESAVSREDLGAARRILNQLEGSYGDHPDVIVARRVVDELDQLLRIRESRNLQKTGQEDWNEFRTLRASKESIEETWKAAVDELHPWQPVWERKKELDAWHELSRIDREISDVYNRTLLSLHQALEEAPDGYGQARRVHEILEEIYMDRYQEALLKGSVTLPPSFFWGMVESQGLDSYRKEQVDKVTFASDPPGADVYCFRYETREERLVPLPFDPRRGAEESREGLLRNDSFLVVGKVWSNEDGFPFRGGDRFLKVRGREVGSRTELASILSGLGADERVEVEFLRDGGHLKESWTPFPAAFYEEIPKESLSPLRPGRLVDIRVQLGLTFEGYPLDIVAGCHMGQTGVGRPIEVSLPRGSYLFLLRADGHEDVRYPVVIPSEVSEFRVKLLKREEIPEDFVYIPEGKFSCGGDREAYLGMDRASEEVPGYLIGRHEVTFGQYLEFIRDIADAGRIDENGSAEPLTDWSSEELSPYVPLQTKARGRIRVIPKYGGREYLVPDSQGVWRSRMALDYPLLGVSVLALMDYAIWLSRRHEGRWRFRLPRDLEWEKAARGVDRRTFIWGDYLLWSFSSSGLCRYPGPGKRPVEGVGSYPFDESVFGVRDLAGSMKEPTSLMGDDRMYTLRGGEWDTLDHRDFRIVTRNRTRPHFTWNYMGLRLVAEIPEGQPRGSR